MSALFQPPRQAQEEQRPSWECQHEIHELRTRRIAGGGIQYVHQCLSCGRAVGSAVAHDKVAVLPPYWDEDTARLYDERCRQRRAEREAAFERGRTERRESYQRYLMTAEWQAKRKAVLAREQYVCQGCGTSRATEVHHLSYEHVGRELLYQLVALCGECHRTAHDASR